MNLLRQLKWRIVAAHMVVVLVGVVLVLAMAYISMRLIVPPSVTDSLAVLSEIHTPADVSAATTQLLDAFRGSVFTAVLVAAAGAVLAGLGTSLLLAREILRPLRELASSSQRIALGHYDERIATPPSDELAMVASSFNQMAATLARVEEQRVALIGNVSHELRTPLTGLQGYLEGLQDGLFPSSEETFGLMAAEVNRLRRLVDNLQALSRVEAGQIDLNLQDLDLVPLVQRVASQLQPQLHAKSLDLVLADAMHSLWVHADGDRVAQVLINLLGNAIRYTPAGGKITICLAATPQGAEVGVCDTGEGIPAEALPYVFERFYRVDPSRARKSGGSGIGLTIARHLVWSMGGELTATSDGPGRGSTFAFTLPAPFQPHPAG